MPKVPQYQIQMGVPRGGIGVMDTINLSTPYTRTVAGIGDMMARRGEQILQEYDTTKAYSAFTSLRDQARVKLSELLERQGESALGVQKDYTEWERKTRNKIESGNLDAASQKSLFSKLAEQQRDGDLNSLAGHEAQQNRIFKKQTHEGLTNVYGRDIRGVALDDVESTRMINEWMTATDSLFPGQNNTSLKISGLEYFRVQQMNEYIDKDPKRAEQKLEEWKLDLGDKYDALKKRLESQREDNKLNEAYEKMHTQFGTNYERAMSWLAVPKNQQSLNLEFKEVNAIHSRFSQLLSDRERTERMGREGLEQEQKANDAAVLQSLYNPAAAKIDVHDLHRRRKISNAMYEHAINVRESTKVDNPYATNELDDKIARGVNIDMDVTRYVEQGIIKESTAANYLKHQTNEQSKRAMQYIDRALRPSEADKWSPDKHLKYADATRLYHAKINSGMDYEQAAYEVVKGYIDGVRRTNRTLPTPDGLTPDQKTDLTALENAKNILVQKLQSGQMPPAVYNEKMRALDTLIKNAEEALKADETDAELEAIRKKKVQK